MIGSVTQTGTRTGIEFLERQIGMLLRGADPVKQRQAAHAASALAVESTGLNEPTVGLGLKQVEHGPYGNSPHRAQLASLVEQLDATAWRLQEQPETNHEYSRASGRARAASAVWSALDDDPLKASLEAVYEANAAIHDLDRLALVIRQALEEPEGGN